jgi:hypothetical protein
MPSKKSTDLTEEQIAIPDKVEEEAFTPPVKPLLCGHINKHHRGINGRLEDLACTLPDGHDGDHQAEYDCLRPFDGSYEHAQLPRVAMSQKIINNALVPSEYVKVKETAFWSDAAGVPAAQIKADADQLARLKQSRQPGIDGKAYEESHSTRL